MRDRTCSISSHEYGATRTVKVGHERLTDTATGKYLAGRVAAVLLLKGKAGEMTRFSPPGFYVGLIGCSRVEAELAAEEAKMLAVGRATPRCPPRSPDRAIPAFPSVLPTFANVNRGLLRKAMGLAKNPLGHGRFHLWICAWLSTAHDHLPRRAKWLLEGNGKLSAPIR